MPAAAPADWSRALTDPDASDGTIRAADGIIAEAQLAHVAARPPGGAGRTLVIISLAGGDLAQREALADRVIAVAREALAPAPAVNRLAAVFAHLSQTAAPPRPPHTTITPTTITLAAEKLTEGTVLAAAPAQRPDAAASPYEAPFVLAPLSRHER